MKNLSSTTKNITGIIIKLAFSGDTNLVLTLITNEDKKISVYIPNAKGKKNQGYPEIFDICSFDIIESSDILNKVQNYKFEFSPRNIRENLKKLCTLSLIFEAIEFLTLQDDINKNIFLILQKTITDIEDESDNILIFRHAYLSLINILSILGFNDKNKNPLPSKKNLIMLIEKIEEITERKLNSKELFLSVLPQKK